MKLIPEGLQDFKALRDADAYYIDKSQLIDRILSERATEAFLFTRPRRFGKSLNLSMLDAYLNMRYAGNTWFDGLSISDSRPDDPEKNSIPVVCLDMRMSSETYPGFIERFRSMISDVFKEFPELSSTDMQDPDDVDLFRQIKSQNSNIGNLSRSMILLTRMLARQFGRKPVILIDEYDAPLNGAYGSAGYQEILSFLRDFYSMSLKGNHHLRFGVVTGIMQIAKESIFSGFNNLSVNNIFSTDMDEMFGFTPAEVQRLCADYGRPDQFSEAREWYDGYRFGNAEIYNPWSVLLYVKRGFIPDAYWASTSGNSIIRDMLSSPDPGINDALQILGSGGNVRAYLDSRITFSDIGSSRGLFSVMALSGYLRAEREGSAFVMSVPNREMYLVFARDILTGLDDGPSLDMRVGDLTESLLSNDVDGIIASLGSLAEDLGIMVFNDEHSYQAFLAGLLMHLLGRYRVTADLESGRGFHDIRLESRDGRGPHVVVELKRRGKKNRNVSMDDLAMEALEQIRDRDYVHGLEGTVILYGIAFDGKSPTVASDVLVR